jgi:hypothetical protein
VQFFRFSWHPRTRDLITDAKVLRKRYLRSWFVMDAVALFPFDHVVRIYMAQQSCEGPSCADARNKVRSTRLIRLTKLSRFARLAKLAKLSHLRMLSKVAVQFLKNVGVTQLGVEFGLRVMGLCFLLVACAHLIACLWLHIGISYMEDEDALGFDESGDRMGKNWMLAEYGTVSEANSTGHRRYIDATYWVFVTVSSVGFGDILPISTSEREFTSLAIIFGTFLYAYIIGNFTNMISNMGQDKSNFDAKMRSISELMKSLNVPVELEDKVLEFYTYKFANKTMFNDGLVEELPVRLRADLVLHRFEEVIDKVPFFHGCREDAIVDICAKLKSHAIMPVRTHPTLKHSSLPSLKTAFRSACAHQRATYVHAWCMQLDDIVQRGEPYRELVIITTGKGRSIPDADVESPRAAAVAPKVRDLDAVIEYVEGSFFGELVRAQKHVGVGFCLGVLSHFRAGAYAWSPTTQEFLGFSSSRTMTVRAMRFTEVSTLNPLDIESVLDIHIGLRRRLHRYGKLKKDLTRMMKDDEEVDELAMERMKERIESQFNDSEESELRGKDDVFTPRCLRRRCHPVAVADGSICKISHRKRDDQFQSQIVFTTCCLAAY